MLKTLRILDLALVDRAELEFGPGFTALTGESGAGKSVVLDCLTLLAGVARPRLSPREGARFGLAEAEFTLEGPSGERVRERMEQADLPRDDHLVLARRVEPSGRTRCFAQGQTISRQLLSELAAPLLEQCGQGEAHGLRQAEAQLEALDRYGKLEARRADVGRLYAQWRQSHAELETLSESRAEDERQLDFLTYQIEELERFSVEEHEQRVAELERIEEAARLAETAREVHRELEAPSQGCVPRLSVLSRKVQMVEGTAASNLAERLLAVVEEMREIAGAAERLVRPVGDTDIPGETLEETRSRLRDDIEQLEELGRKHRTPVAELPERKTELQERARRIETRLLRLDAVHEESRKAFDHAIRAAAELHERRQKAGKRLARAVHDEIGALGLKSASFTVHVTADDLTARGSSHVEFGFSANHGNAARPLSRVASGGELARVLLAIRLATRDRPDLMTFDEIDAGTGGELASCVGQALLRASESGQVLCVTHWPQVAGLARAHLRATKRSNGEMATSRIELLEESTRLAELTRMLGGSERTARSHARRLLRPRAA